MGQRVHVDRRRRRRAGDDRRVGLDHDRLRRDAARRRDASANFDENSPNTRCSLRWSISPNVATSQNTVEPPLPSTISQPSGKAEQVGQPGADRADEALHGGLAVRRAEQPRPAGDEGLDLLGADLATGRTRSGRRRAAGRAGCESRRRRPAPTQHVPASTCGIPHYRVRPAASSGADSVHRTCGAGGGGSLARLVREPNLRTVSPRSPSRPPWPSMPRPRRCRPQGENVIGFGAGEPDFPTPEHIVEAAVRRLSGSEEPPVHAGRRAARAARGDRRQDQARQRVRLHGAARCSSRTAASTRCSPRSPRCATRATR